MLPEVVESPKKRKLVDCYTGDGDVHYDVCTGRKHKAVKSCLDSDCQNHHEKREIFFKRERQNLTEATGRLQEMMCQTHNKILEVFCRTDQKCICVLCTIDEHKNHDTVSAAGQRKENQSFQSLSAPLESTDVNDDPFSSLSSFDGVREAVLQFRDKLEDFCEEELKKITDRDVNEPDLHFDIGSDITLDEILDVLLSGESVQNIVHVDGDVASGESHENQPGEPPVAESDHSPNSVTERSSSCVSPPEDPVRETSCDPIISHSQTSGHVKKCTLSTPRRGHKQLRDVPGAGELPSASRLRTLEDNEQDYEDRGLELHKESQLEVCNADFDESSSDESDPGPPIERAISRLSYEMIIECSVTLPDEDTLTPVKEQPAVSATETLSVGGITLSSEDLETLNPGQWLNDNVVHAYLHLLASKSETKVFVFQSFLVQLWRKEDYTHWKYHKVQFQDFHWAFLPVCRFNHWFLIAFNIPERKVCVLDSLKSTSKHDEFLTYWCNFMKTRASLGIETLDGWTLSSIDVAVQTDWSSCGIFLLMNAESLLQNGKPNVSQQKDTGTLRQYIKDKLLQEGK
ncbi:sentrin-specific protease 1-like isoform X4 [Ctenopharyngodon idella]|uniref:sentrin-specific protease 1-like isoform X4 n=1 Tax=Ctenopharyngodon idella TaxID=7959 RepID=UPI0022312174|nr:sentrin-specific protease 1-like isoform X4 [Ctenopharyngodon idella]